MGFPPHRGGDGRGLLVKLPLRGRGGGHRDACVPARVGSNSRGGGGTRGRGPVREKSCSGSSPRWAPKAVMRPLAWRALNRGHEPSSTEVFSPAAVSSPSTPPPMLLPPSPDTTTAASPRGRPEEKGGPGQLLPSGCGPPRRPSRIGGSRALVAYPGSELRGRVKGPLYLPSLFQVQLLLLLLFQGGCRHRRHRAHGSITFTYRVGGGQAVAVVWRWLPPRPFC